MQKIRTFVKRFPLLIVAVALAAGILGGAVAYKNNRDNASNSKQSFNPSSVLPQAVSQPAATTAYDAESLKQYDGKDGHKCYVAVKGTVYEIKDSSYWKQGEHTPSGGRGVCGADMSEIIKQSPHGEAYLVRLPKVGTFTTNANGQ